MMAKIEWYEEILALEPGSKVFFPFAKRLAEDGLHDKALAVLRHGLMQHPEYLEARIFLTHLLFEIGDTQAAMTESQQVFSRLSLYPAFWEALSLANEALPGDMNLAMRFLAEGLRAPGLTLAAAVRRGLAPQTDERTAPVALPESVEPAEPALETDVPESGLPESGLPETEVETEVETEAEAEVEVEVEAEIEPIAAEVSENEQPEVDPLAPVAEEMEISTELPAPFAAELAESAELAEPAESAESAELAEPAELAESAEPVESAESAEPSLTEPLLTEPLLALDDGESPLLFLDEVPGEPEPAVTELAVEPENVDTVLADAASVDEALAEFGGASEADGLAETEDLSETADALDSLITDDAHVSDSSDGDEPQGEEPLLSLADLEELDKTLFSEPVASETSAEAADALESVDVDTPAAELDEALEAETPQADALPGDDDELEKGEASEPQQPKPVESKPALPEPTSPKPASPEPTSPEPASPEPVVEEEPEMVPEISASPKPASPEPTSPEPTSPEPASPEPVVEEEPEMVPEISASPKPASPEPTSPEPTSPEPTSPEPALPAFSESTDDDIPDDGPVRTRSMADVLAEQGDLDGALTIYEELLKKAGPDEAASLSAHMDTLRGMKSVEKPEPKAAPRSDKAGLRSMLENLAGRLEKRAKSDSKR